jgi:hypothetical protein
LQAIFKAMFSEAAFAELRDFLVTGLWGQRIELTLTPAQPEVGTLARIEWDFSLMGEPYGTLSIARRASYTVEPVGSHDILIDCDSLAIILTAGAEEARLEITPFVLIPSINYFNAPERVSLGEPSRATWRTQDTSFLQLLVVQGDIQKYLEAPPQGYLEFTPWKMGGLHLTLIAESKHALYSPRARIEAKRTVKVTAPPLWSHGNLKVTQNAQMHHRSPAMAAGIADHVWSTREWLLWPVLGTEMIARQFR